MKRGKKLEKERRKKETVVHDMSTFEIKIFEFQQLINNSKNAHSLRQMRVGLNHIRRWISLFRHIFM